MIDEHLDDIFMKVQTPSVKNSNDQTNLLSKTIFFISLCLQIKA